MRVLGIAAGLAFAAAGLAPDPVEAGCNNVVVARIAFPPGDYCWSYRGSATVFTGGFGGGQQVSVHMSGESTEYDPRSGRDITSIAPRAPDVSGPGNFYTGGDGGNLSFVTPRAGFYRFSFSPCAMWGGDGTVEICAR